MLSSCQTIEPFLPNPCPIALIDRVETPQLQSVPWSVEGEEPSEKFVLDKEGFLVYSDNLVNLINYSIAQESQITYYRTRIQDCE